MGNSLSVFEHNSSVPKQQKVSSGTPGTQKDERRDKRTLSLLRTQVMEPLDPDWPYYMSVGLGSNRGLALASLWESVRVWEAENAPTGCGGCWTTALGKLP